MYLCVLNDLQFPNLLRKKTIDTTQTLLSPSVADCKSSGHIHVLFKIIKAKGINALNAELKYINTHLGKQCTHSTNTFYN